MEQVTSSTEVDLINELFFPSTVAYSPNSNSNGTSYVDLDTDKERNMLNPIRSNRLFSLYIKITSFNFQQWYSGWIYTKGKCKRIQFSSIYGRKVELDQHRYFYFYFYFFTFASCSNLAPVISYCLLHCIQKQTRWNEERSDIRELK